MRILILGGAGMLGHKLVQSFNDKFEVWSTIRSAYKNVERYGIFPRERTLELIDVEDEVSLRRSIEFVNPDVVINAVGIIKQLPSANNVIKTLCINSILPHRLQQMSSEIGFRLICISTDCVFSGEKGNYAEEDRADAYDLYGKSKNLGEVVEGNCLTIRTSIVGRELNTTHSLIEWFLSNQGGSVNGYKNAIYSGFPTIVFADIIADLINKFPNLRGIYHISSDPINKLELLKLVKSAFSAGIKIIPFEDFRIDRSLDSTRFRGETGFAPPDWEKMIAKMADDPTPYDEWRK